MEHKRTHYREAGRASVEVLYEPTIKPKWDTLQRDLLNDTAGIDLNYRQQATTKVDDHYYVRNLVGIIGLLSFLLTLVSTLAGVYLSNQLVFALFTAASLLVGIVTLIQKRVVWLAVVYAVIGPVAWFIITNSSTYSASVLLIASLGFSVLLIQKIKHHYAAWLANSPRLIGDNQTKAEQLWRDRYQGHDWKALGILAGFIVLILSFGSQPLKGFSHVLLLTTIFFGVAVGYSTKFCRARSTIKLCWEAVVSWFNYGRIQPVDPIWQEFEDDEPNLITAYLFSAIVSLGPFILIGGLLIVFTGKPKNQSLLEPIMTAFVLFGVIAVLFGTYTTIRGIYQRYGTIFAHPINPPGVFQSPGGRWIHRNLMATLTLFSLFISAIQFTQYSPVVFVYGDSNLWVQSFSHVVRDELSFTWLTSKLYRYEPLSAKQIIRNLPTDEVVLLKRLKPADREEYLYGIQTVHYLNSGPGAWISLALDSALSGHALGIWAVLVSFVTCLLLPIVIFSAVCLLVAGRALEDYRVALSGLESEESDWKNYVRRLQASPKGQDYIWLGTHATEDYPVLLHRDILREHAHILGDTGSGKTALGIAPMLEQLVQAGDAAVIIDLKGDITLFETARVAAGERFKFFTNELGKATYAFNPFGQLHREHINLNQICEVFLSALALEHGDGYGRSYYSRVARNLLMRTLAQYPDVASFAELKQRIESMANDAEQRRDAFELIAVVESLAGYPALNVTEEVSPQVAREAIFMPDVLAKNQVVYFWLPPAIEAATAREIAKLAFHTLFTSAYQYQRIWQKQARVWVIIDEFQHVASLSFKVILQQARSMGIGLILANQTAADLWVADTNLKDTVQANTRFKQYFSISNKMEREELSKNSGETMYSFQGIGPRMMLNDLIELSDERQSSVVLISRGKGLTQYGGLAFPLHSLYHITEREYQRRSAAPWPDPTDSTIVNRHKERSDPRPSEADQPLSTANILSDNEPPPTASEKAKRSAWAQHLRSLYEERNRARTKSASGV